MASKKPIEETVLDVTELPEAPIVETITEQVEPPPVKEQTRVSSIRAQAGDSYLSIAEQFTTPGRAARELARRMAEANGNAPIRINSRIMIPTAD
jgi:hypothetical protein